MSARTLARIVVLGNLVAALTLAAARPAGAARDVRCAQALAKASAKFVGVALEATQHCVLLRAAGKLPASSCRMLDTSTGDAGTDAALGAARTRLADGLRPCPDGLVSLSCSGLYFGGAGVGVPLPATIPDKGTSILKVASCSGTKMTLSSVAAGESGATQRTCTASGCLFGPPLPIPNPSRPAT